MPVVGVGEVGRGGVCVWIDKAQSPPNLYYKWRLDCGVFSAIPIDRIVPLLSPLNKETQLPSN